MILETIKTNNVFRVNVKNLSQTRVSTGIGFLRYDSNYTVFIDQKLFMIEIIDAHQLDKIDYFLRIKNNIAIVNIVEAIREKYFTMEIIFLSFPIKNTFETFYINLDEKILETAKKKGFIKNANNTDELAKFLKKKISFSINGDNYFFVSTANSTVNDVLNLEENIILKIEELNKDKKILNKSNNISEEEKNKKIIKIEMEINELSSKQTFDNLEKIKKDLAFTIHGENIHIPVEKNIDESSNYRFKAMRLVSFEKILKRDTFQLVRGEIEFKNGLMSARIAKELGNIIEEDGSYLRSWDRYLEEEGNQLIKRAKLVGELRLLSIEPNGNGYNLKFENLHEILSTDDWISFVDNVDSYLNSDINFIEYLKEKEQLLKLTNGIKRSTNKSYKIENINGNFISIKTDENIDKYKNMKVVLSIYGNEAQLSRKYQARQRLLEGKSGNPVLGLIIDGKDKAKEYLGKNVTKKISPLSMYVRDKIFPKNAPTPNQEEAISIALNTPDIAIIQGPPGTGKTTVLTAIIERLNEEADPTHDIKGEILVAGFQHDAVENIISRLQINGIPTPKFGNKSDNIADFDSYERIINWGKEIVKSIKNNLPEFSNHIKINKINKYFQIYLASPSIQNTLQLLKFVKNNLDDSVVVEKCNNLIDKLEQKNTASINDMKYIYSLRTSKDSFLDDGKDRNNDLLISSIGQLLNDEEKNLLTFINNDSLEDYLEKLTELKYVLIDRLYPKPFFRSEKPNDEILKLKDLIDNSLIVGGTSTDKKAMVLINYINELENNPFALKSLIEEFSYVYSATTGQSMGKEILKAKKNKDDRYITYDTVIIDEAARVTPMDLLIAIVQAKRRIILVGDHRQLPHMVDDEIVESANLDEDEKIKESMFGYLKNRAIELETYDGIKRTITLQNQYRTHPILGQFVSDNFYKKHGEDFESPLGTIIGKPDDFFYHNLDGINNIPAVWINVNHNPLNHNPRSRPCEAKQIMSKLRLWINSENGKDFYFGIITFYRDQVKTIEKELIEEFSKEEIEEFKHRLKIGTVDSFQGMEFDIVFLSVVRSRDIKTINNSIEDYKLFGFLTSKNRLCVSMSRQKRSLIVVGDKDFFEHDRAKSDVSELYNFLQLCKQEGKVL